MNRQTTVPFDFFMNFLQKKPSQDFTSQSAGITLVYTITIFLNALLLFLVQPMIAKILLPRMGGTPSVWNTCVLFFQAMLLVGYGYSYLATSKWPARTQIGIHLGLLLLAMLVFPVAVAQGEASERWHPLLCLLGTLFLSIGPPFVMLSTGGSLLQHWFSKTRHALAGDPYFLYGASNIGSLVALLAYPTLIEPRMPLSQQTRSWSIGYAIVALLIGTCAWLRLKQAGGEIKNDAEEEQTASPPPLTNSKRLLWVGLSFTPSSLMLGVTTYLTTDITPIPFLWALPLTAYLLTFVIAFARSFPRTLSKLLWSWLPIYSIVILFLILTRAPLPVWLHIALHLLMLFYAAQLCHLRLAETRPSAAHVTEFYLWIAVGGVSGGLFNSLLAPVLFDSTAEYPLALVLALMFRRQPKREPSAIGKGFPLVAKDLLFAIFPGLLTLVLAIGLKSLNVSPARTMVASLGPSLLISYAAARRPLRFALAVGAIILGAVPFSDLLFGQTLYTERNFFGTLRVTQDGQFLNLFHGNTNHGKQFLAPARRCEPLSYYHRNGPIGQALDAFADRPASANFAVIGLGSGAMASYAKPGEQWTFYELDPEVIRLARPGGYFSYIEKCAGGRVETVAGDARLQLQRAPERHYSLIALDAFSSDAIPTHLLTLEAMQLYLSKTADGGRLAFHLSNKYIDLPPIIANLGRRLNLVCLVNDELTAKAEGESAALWVVLARRSEDLGRLREDPRWRKISGLDNAPIWTDDFADVFGAIRWR